MSLLNSANFTLLAPGALASPEMLLVFLLFAGVTAVASVGFTVWLGYQIVRVMVLLVLRLAGAMVGRSLGGSGRPATEPAAIVACPDPVCRSVNPHHARFCRQCGRMLKAATA